MASRAMARRRAPGVCAFLSISTVLVLAAAASAADHYWSEPAGGWFEDSANWYGDPPPPADANAVFDLDTAGYSVSFASSPTSRQLVVLNDGVMLDLAGQTWTLGDADASVVVGELDGDVADLAVTGGTLAGTQMRIARSWSSVGTVTVAAGGEIDLTGAAWVGEFGDGVLNVDAGTVSCASLDVGVFSGSEGTVTVSGATGRLDCTDWLQVGDVWDGYLFVEAGAEMTVGANATVGRGMESDGYLSVLGGGSSMAVAGQLTVAQDGWGLLDVFDGGNVTSSGGDIAWNPSARGAVNVAGADAEWEVLGGWLRIGQAGHGAMIVSEGGLVTGATLAMLGGVSGGEGQVKVVDAGSLWRVNGSLMVGAVADAQGRIRVEGGGAIECAHASLASSGGAGQVVVTGAGSAWYCTGNVAVGDAGEGWLDVQAGGLVTTDGDARLGDDGGSSGEATIHGASSRWAIGGELDVGRLGTGTLRIDYGGSLSCDAMAVGRLGGSAGEVTVTGGGSCLDVASDLDVGAGGDGSLSVSDAAVVDCGGLFLAQSGSATSGDVTVTGASTTMTVRDNATVGDSVATGVLTVSDAAGVDVANTLYVNAGSRLELADGTVTAGTVWLDGGRIAGHGTVEASFALAPNLVASGGTLALGTGQTGSVGFWSAGTAEVHSGATLALRAANTASLPGTVTLANGVLLARNGVDVGAGGSIQGYGVVVGSATAGGAPAWSGAPTGAVSLSALDIADSDAVVYTNGQADLSGQTTLDGGYLGVYDPSSTETLRVGSGGSISGWGDIDAHVVLNNAVLDADAGGIYVTGGAGRSLDGYGILVGDVRADFYDIDAPKGTVDLASDLDIGDREAEVFSDGPARISSRVTLDGGFLESLTGLEINYGGVLEGTGWVYGAISGSGAIVATGDLDLGDPFALEGFANGGTLDVGEHTVRLHSFGPAKLGELTILRGGTLQATACLEMPSTGQLRGGGVVDASLDLANAFIQAADGEGIHVTGSLTGYGILLGDVTAGQLTLLTAPTGTVAWSASVEWYEGLVVGNQQGYVCSAGRALFESSLDIAGGTLHAPNGIAFGGLGDAEIEGFGTVAGAVSGELEIWVEGGTLALGDAARADGVAISGGYVEVDSDAVLELLDADEAELGCWRAELDGGVLIARNGLRLGDETELRGHGVVVGEFSGGLPYIYNPDWPVDLDVPLDVGAEQARVFSAGRARLSETTLAGGVLQAPSGVRFREATLSGFGTVEADVELDSAVLSADAGQTIEITGDVSGCGVVVGDVLAGGWSIAAPTGSVEFGDLDVGPRTAIVYSYGPAIVEGTISLTGGQVFVPPTGLGLDDGSALMGFGTVSGPLIGSVGSLIWATGGDLVLGDPGSYAGFHTDGVIDVSDRTVTILSASIANLGSWTDLDGGSLVAASGLALGPGDNLHGSGAVDAPVHAAAGSVIQADGPLTLGDPAALDGFRSDGVLHVGSHAVTLHDRNRAVLAALTTLGEGGSGGELSAPNGMVLENGKDLAGLGDVHGNFENQGYVLGEGLGLTFHDDVTGAGEFDGNVAFAGAYSPGNSPAIVGFGGSVTFLSSAELRIELADTDNSDPHNASYDSLDVAGDVALAGALSLSWLYDSDDANSRFGGAYTILAYGGGRFGSFDEVVGQIAAYVDDSVFPDGIEYDDVSGEVRLHLYDLLDGDANLDGYVGRDDLLDLRTGHDTGGAGWVLGDFDFNGVVDAEDYLIWKANVGSGVPGAVPEPATLVLLAAASVALLHRKRGAR